jgi:galactofuranose transport system substrate-binding protein
VRRRNFLAIAGIVPVGAALAACGDKDADDTGSGSTGGGGDKIVIGFSQVGAESGWRTANTKSIQESLSAANGFDLKFVDAQGKQENQFTALRSFITQKVDVIAFSPVVVDGWDAVLKEAKDANIPVILTDRAVSAPADLYVSFLGSDFVVEGQKAGEWLVEQYKGKTDPVAIVELQGTTGAAPAIDRAKGFAEKIAAAPNLKVVKSQTGNFTRADGKTVMETFLQSTPKIDVLYAHNDDMGLGAIEAIEAAGKKPGVDIKIITVDAVKDGMTALSEGKINYIVECSPLLGPQLAEIAKAVKAGQTVEKRILTKETTFTQEQAKTELPNRKY